SRKKDRWPQVDALQTRKFILQGLDCANCAATIEAEIEREIGLTGTGINFASRSIFLPAVHAAKVQQIIDRIEPGVKLVEAAVAAPRHAVNAHNYGCAYEHVHGGAHARDYGHAHDGY